MHSDTPPTLMERGFWRTKCAETPPPEFLRIPCAPTPLVEFLRIPVRSDTPPSLIGYEVSGALGAQKLHYQFLSDIPAVRKTPLVEFLRIPVRSDTPPFLIRNKVSGTPGVQKLHYRSFLGSPGAVILQCLTGNQVFSAQRS